MGTRVARVIQPGWGRIVLTLMPEAFKGSRATPGGHDRKHVAPELLHMEDLQTKRLRCSQRPISFPLV